MYKYVKLVLKLNSPNYPIGSFSFKNLSGFAGLFRGPGAVRKPRLPVQGIQNCPNNEKLNSPNYPKSPLDISQRSLYHKYIF